METEESNFAAGKVKAGMKTIQLHLKGLPEDKMEVSTWVEEWPGWGTNVKKPQYHL